MNAKTPSETESFDAAELGTMMREMRENLGHELDSVARDLRIRLVYLEAIESGRLSDLPGNAYVSGFLRSYSDFLGLEGNEIVRRFKMTGAEISSQPQLHLPSPVEEGRLPTASILLVAAIIATAAYGGWYYLSGTGKGPMETVASLPKELSGLVDDVKNQTAPTAVAKSPAAPEATSDTAAQTMPPEQTPETTAAETGPTNTVTSAQPAPEPVSAAVDSLAKSPATSTASPGSEQQPEPAAAIVEQPAVAVTSVVAEAMPAPKPVEKPALAAVVPATPAEPVTPVIPAAALAPESVAQTPTPAPTDAAASAPAPIVAPVVENAVRTAAVSPSSRPDTAPSVSSNPAPTETASRTSSETPSSPGLPGGGVRIVVRATADSYVAVRTSDNQPLFSQLMRRGDSYEVPSGADLILETGNAGGLQITVGGKRAPSLGPIGEIRRNISLDGDKLLSGIN
jgi:cytoskeleton protein RodZ